MKPKIRFQVRVDNLVIGPGKIALLEAVEETGSISKAAKRCGMGFRRAWQLLETLKPPFSAPVLETQVGGRKGGGARITPFGRALVSHYRQAERAARTASEPLLSMIDEKRIGQNDRVEDDGVEDA